MFKTGALWGIAATGAGILMVGCATTAPTPAARGCADAHLSIYFDENSAALTGPARDLIDEAGHRAVACRVQAVEVVGLADYRGPADVNLTLSRQRAEVVARALEKAGLPTPRFSVTAEGDAGAQAAPGVAVPMRREAQVVIHYAGS